MIKKISGTVCLALVLMAAVSGHGADEFGLASPIIIKADWQSGEMAPVDLNNDGRPDLVTVNNAKSLLQMQIQQEPVDGVLQFKKKETVLEEAISSLATGDFNGDGLADIALGRGAENAVVRLQNGDGELEPAVELDGAGGLVQAADIDLDGQVDLLAIHQNKMILFYGPMADGEEAGAKKNRQEFVMAASPGVRPIVQDVDGNGLPDIVYLDGQRRSRVWVRRQFDSRKWMLEMPYSISDAGGTAAWMTKQDDQTKCGIATIDIKTGSLRSYLFQEDKTDANKEFRLNGPAYLSFESRGMMGREQAVKADLEGNGRTSVVIYPGNGAELTLFIQNDAGLLEKKTAPSLSDISALTVAPRKGGDLIFSLSENEETIGASLYSEDRGLTIPTLLNARHKPLVMTGGDLDGSGKVDLLYLYRKEDSSLAAAIYLDPEKPEVLRGPADRTLNLPIGQEVEPEDLLSADINSDGRGDLVIFQKYNPLVLLLQQENGEFEAFSADQGMKKGVFFKVGPGQIIVEDIDGEKGNELIVARESLARAYHVSEKGELRLVEQFNGKNTSARIDSIAVADLDGSGSKEVILMDSVNQVFTIYARDAEGAFALAEHLDAKDVRAARLMPLHANDDPYEDLLAYEEGKLQLYYSNMQPWQFQAEWRNAPEEEEWQYARIFALPILSPQGKALELLALEGTEHVLEMFAPHAEEAGQFERFFHFKVYDDAGSMGSGRGGRQEPRELRAADMDGDGMNDLIALMHDNIVIYLQRQD
ncbi:MAG: FG-GAP repeat domain-containing protein [bacterium]